MVSDGVDEPDPRNQVLKDLGTFIQQQRESGREILLSIDANESSEHHTRWRAFKEANLLHDVQESRLQTMPQSMRMGSTARIDHMVATEGILQYVTAAGFLGYHRALISDHVLLWADIDLKSFFRGEGPKITPPQARDFSYDNIEMREKFLRELDEIHGHQRIPQRVMTLETELKMFGATPALVKRYNSLDAEIVDTIKAAIRKTVKQKQHGYARSPAISAAGNEVLFWKSVLATSRRGLPLSNGAIALAERNGCDMELAASLNPRTVNDEL